jgi:KDO2-lipid IV(A) lauroyltransferase
MKNPEIHRNPRRYSRHGSRLDPLREKIARSVARPFFALLAVLARILPHDTLIRLSVACSRVVYVAFPGLRSSLLKNAAHILGESSSPSARADLARGVLASFGRFLVEFVSPDASSPRQDLAANTVGREHFEAAAAPGKGIIACTLHMGNYELASMELAALRRNVAIVFNKERIGFLERIRSRRRTQKHLDEIVIDTSRFFGVEALARLRENGIVLLAGDQVKARDGERFSFLHGTAPFSLWPARLSLASGAPILPAFNVRKSDGSYCLQLEPPIFPTEGASSREILEELVSVFERYVSKHGDQWLMIRKFWVEER